ncbi:MFS transporter [Sphingomonas sp. SORGH_AS_0879]|uniref:AmpG family muropeptide MFS transporter n=1 Tax=Sphingomonas sp. SORGH_AS_0879 TaxID=3041790 RepID=UPI002780EA44|nr:MFS transporter [Sphingomonas sp. SORGH_AS_0879]MDQ1230864.1 PAT family beta-lactamase induction signal transducer AmpG [Sphingomonas sp. SORGH_AS_0879]
MASARWLDGVRPYVEAAPLASLALGISSAFPLTMINATLSSRLAEAGIEKKSVTAFALVILAYNFKFLWAWIVEGVKIPVLHRLGQRVSWLLVVAGLVCLAAVGLGLTDPRVSLAQTAMAAIALGIAGATFDIVIDAYRIELLEPRQFGVGAGMGQYGWRIGSALVASLSLVVATRAGWSVAYLVSCAFALPAVLTALLMGEPARHSEITAKRPTEGIVRAVVGPFAEFFRRQGAAIILAFILVHKIGDTLANLTFRLLFNDLGFSKDEIALYDVGVGFWALLIGVFVGGILYARLGMKRSVLISLVLMAVSNLSFAGLAALGHSNWGMAGAIGFENFSSGIGGVTVVAYFSALTDLRFTAAQYALISAAASIVGRILSGTTAGALVERFGYVDFYLLTTVVAAPGVILFWWMARSGLIDRSIGSAGVKGEGDARRGEPVRS